MSSSSEVHLSSPGRVCLLGDHCDWAGGTCLAASIPLRLRGVARRRGDRLLVVESSEGGSLLRGSYPLDEPGFAPDDPLRYAAAAVVALTEHGILLKGTELRVSSDLPARRGLGSSAAFTLLVIKGLAKMAEVSLTPREMAELAYHAEREILGIECGLMDQAASVAARPVFLDFSGPSMSVEELELPVPVHLALGDCGGKKDASIILSDLNRSRRGDPASNAARPSRNTAQSVAYAFDDLFPTLVRQGRDALTRGDLRALGEAMTVAQAVYDEYLRPASQELQGEELPRLLDVCREGSALGQKWTGSGGDGAFLALARDEAHQRELAERLEEAGARAVAITLGA